MNRLLRASLEPSAHACREGWRGGCILLFVIVSLLFRYCLVGIKGEVSLSAGD